MTKTITRTKSAEPSKTQRQNPPPAAMSDEPSIVVARTLADLIAKAAKAYGTLERGEICVHSETFVEISAEVLSTLINGEDSDGAKIFYRVAACLQGALAHDLVDCPTALLRHQLVEDALKLADSASTSYGFCEDPCVSLANGIDAGRSAGGRDPLNGYTTTQASVVFGFIATRANMARQYCSSRAESEIDPAFAADMFEQIGIAADQMIGGEIVGTPADWMIGQSFHQAGKAVQA